MNSDLIIMGSYNPKSIWLRAVLLKPRGLGWTVFRLTCLVLSNIYGLLVHIRHTLYQREILKTKHVPRAKDGSSVKVISVGNITAGGTGKTPMAAYITKWLAAQGLNPVIISRGYGRPRQGQVPQGLPDDEAFILQEPGLKGVLRRLGGNRYQIASELIKQDKCLRSIVLDDGFQHIGLARDLDIVMINTLNPFGAKQLLPYGALREPLSALARADLFVLTHTNLCNPQDKKEVIDYLSRFNKPLVELTYQPTGLISLADDNAMEPLSVLKTKPAWGFCGIGDPLGFKQTLEATGIKLKGFSVFTDHHPYTVKDVEQLLGRARANGVDKLVTTEKDMVRLHWLKQHLAQPGKLVTGLLDYVSRRRLPIYALKIELTITQGNELLEDRLRRLYL